MLWQETGAAYLYVVGTHHEEIRARGQPAACFVEPGLLKMKLQRGPRHPLLRALRGDDAAVETVLDGTLGVAHDAVFIACGLGARVRGIEKSPELVCLLEEGLPRIARTVPGAARVSVEHGDTLSVLQHLPDASVDVVFLDPMMSRPKGSTPTFDALRAFAWPERAGDALLTAAARVARRRVVLKLGRGAPLPASAVPFLRAERGGSVTYHVHDKQDDKQRM